MADGGSSDELSVNLTNNSPNNGEEDENNSDFPLLIEKGNHKTKIKWLGDLDSLKSFVECKLNLTGSWSYTPTNGGFHVFKASVVTLCFYPGTKTLAVQGAKHEIVRKSICAFYSMEMAEKSSDHVLDEDTQDGHLETTNNNNAAEISNECIEVNDPETSAVNNNQSCSGCEQNTKLISELWMKTTALENKFKCCNPNKRDDNDCPSCEKLRSKVEHLEAERENLLAAIQLLTQDKKAISNSPTSGSIDTKTNDSNSKSNGDGPWIKVGKKGKGKQQGASINNVNKQRQRKNSGECVNNSKPSHNGTANQSRVTIIGDSMTKHINGRKLSKSQKVISKSFPGAVIEDLEHYIKPTLKHKPDKIIIHAGTNNLRNDSPKQINSKLVKVISGIKTQQPSVNIAISSVIKRNDNPALNTKISEVNTLLKTYCEQNNLDYISNDNIQKQCLNTGGLHLNPRGIQALASNFRNYITY